MWGAYLAQTFIFSLSFLLCILALHSLLGLAASATFGFFCFILLINNTTSALKLIQTPYQQAIAFPLLVLSMAQILFLLKKSELRWTNYFLLGLNLGAVFMIRTDWLPILPGIFLFLAFKFYQPKLKIISKNALFLFIIGLAIFPLLIGFRNYYVAGQFTIMPTSGLTNLLPEIKTALGQKIDFHEHSSAKFAIEIIKSFSGHYFDLTIILWNNIYKNIITTSGIRQFLWIITGAFSIFSLFNILKNKQWKSSSALICLLASFIPLMIVSSFFGQHNGIAMFAIYDFFVVMILAVNIHTILNIPAVNYYSTKIYGKIIK
jgi:hypothetical protein